MCEKKNAIKPVKELPKRRLQRETLYDEVGRGSLYACMDTTFGLSGMREAKVRRKTFAAREDLLKQMGKIAERRGLTLYNLVNEALELTIRAEDMGLDLKKLVDEHELHKRAKNSGFILVPEGLWHDLVEEAYQRAKIQSLKNWFEAGEWIAKRYISSGFKDPFEAFKVNLESFTWNVSEFSITRDGETAMVRLISPRFSESHATLFSSLLEGALETFGYKVISRDISSGAIRIRAERGGTLD